MEKIVYVKSLDAKLTLIRESLMESYKEIVNAALSRDGVDVNKSFFKVRLSSGKNKIAMIKAFKKNLVVYFAADAGKLSKKYNVTDMSASKSYKNYPAKMILETKKDLKNALELLDKLMRKAGCENERQAELFTEDKLPVKEFNELVAIGLIKKYVRYYDDPENTDVAEAVEEAKTEMVPVTFRVNVKGYGTQKLYLFTNYAEWKLEGALKMEKLDEHNFTLTTSFPKDYSLEFKISLEDNWYGVEKGIFGEEIKNHSYIVSHEMTVEDIIYNFRNE